MFLWDSREFWEGFPGNRFPHKRALQHRRWGRDVTVSRRCSQAAKQRPVLYLNHDMARMSWGIYVFLHSPSYIRSKCVYGWIYETQLETYRKGLSPRRNEILINWRIHWYIGKIKRETFVNQNHVSVLRWGWKIL